MKNLFDIVKRDENGLVAAIIQDATKIGRAHV